MVAFFMDYLPSVGDPFGELKPNSKPAASPLFFVSIKRHYKSFGFTYAINSFSTSNQDLGLIFFIP
jgi:hypothetical protein